MITLIAGLTRIAAALIAIVSTVVPFIAADLVWLTLCTAVVQGAVVGHILHFAILARPRQ